MKAIVVSQYGGPEVLSVQEVATPTPKDNEVLIKVQASCLTRASAMMRSGTPRFARLFLGFGRPKYPITGSCFAGVVAEVGSGVDSFEVGDAVFGETAATFGTNAEYVCVAADGIILPMPDYLSFEEAAVICDGPVTSMNFLKRLGHVQAGQKVLINGASGSLGVAAVQIAKHMGAEVTGVCSTNNVALVKSLGADHVINYKEEDFTQAGKQYDVIYDTVGTSCFRKCKNILTEKGMFLSPVLNMKVVLPMLGNWMRSKKVKFDATGLKQAKEVKGFIKEVLAMMSKGDYDMVLERRYVMEEVQEAHRYIDSGRKRGNIVLSIR